jgi:hypothetical protein
VTFPFLETEKPIIFWGITSHEWMLATGGAGNISWHESWDDAISALRIFYSKKAQKEPAARYRRLYWDNWDDAQNNIVDLGR